MKLVGLKAFRLMNSVMGDRAQYDRAPTSPNTTANNHGQTGDVSKARLTLSSCHHTPTPSVRVSVLATVAIGGEIRMGIASEACREVVIGTA